MIRKLPPPGPKEVFFWLPHCFPLRDGGKLWIWLESAWRHPTGYGWEYVARNGHLVWSEYTQD